MTKGPRDTMLGRLSVFRSKAFVGAVASALYEAADMVSAEASRLITTGSVSGKNHQPSPPGTPPHNDTGHLKGNIKVSQPRPDVGRVTSHARYSAVHEFGSSTHPARPFLRPARDNVKGRAKRQLEAKLNKILRRK